MEYEPIPGNVRDELAAAFLRIAHPGFYAVDAATRAIVNTIDSLIQQRIAEALDNRAGPYAAEAVGRDETKQ